jgi:hypothetical protein
MIGPRSAPITIPPFFSMPDSIVFFAYPSSPPQLGETMTTAATHIDRVGGIRGRRWQDMHVGGRLVISQILAEIDVADVGIYEITALNPNVLFELGYGLSRAKQVFPVLDDSVVDAMDRWKEMRILSSAGFTPYHNSDDIYSAILRERPDLREFSVYEESVQPALRPAGSPSLFYLTSVHGDDASAALTRVIRSEGSRGIRVAAADVRETTVQPLTWYAQQIYDSVAVVLHFESPLKRDHAIHNARAAFLGGFAHGQGKPLLMLASEDYSPPFDYQDLLFIYRTAAECSNRASYWLTRELQSTHLYLASIAADRPQRQLATELRTLNLGEPVAENEASDLESYFVDTKIYYDVMSEHTAVYVGRRGSGKTATMLVAARELSDDRRNLVCTITPSEYELLALARLLSTYKERDTRGYVVRAIWKFLLYSEIALAAVRDIASRPAGLQPDAPEWELSLFLEGAGSRPQGRFRHSARSRDQAT